MKRDEPTPQDFDVRHLEMSLLGWAVTWPDRFYEVQDLRPEHFRTPACQRVFRMLRDLYLEHGAGPLQTPSMIAQAMTRAGMTEADAFAFLTECHDHAPSGPEAIGPIRRSVVQAALRTALGEASDQLKALASSGDSSAEDLANDASKLILDAVANTAELSVRDMRDEMQEEADRMDRSLEGDIHEERGHPTGISALDHLISGLHPGEMTIIGARPSVGKSALLGAVAHALLSQGLPGLVFSMEMSCRDYARRMICHTAGVDLHQARNRLLSPSDHKAYIRSANEWAKTAWFINDESHVSISRASAIARRLFFEHGIRWIAFDYLQLMDHQQRKNDNNNNAVERTSRAIKALARSLNVPILCLAQLNRGLENRQQNRPRLSDLRDSGALEQDADTVVFIHRESMYWSREIAEQHAHDEWEPAELIVAKQRNGPVGTARVAFYRKSARFADAPAEVESTLGWTPSEEPSFGPF